MFNVFKLYPDSFQFPTGDWSLWVIMMRQSCLCLVLFHWMLVKISFKLIFSYSSHGKSSSSVLLEGIRARVALLKSQQRFLVGFKAGDWEGHLRAFQDLYLHQALIDLDVYLLFLSSTLSEVNASGKAALSRSHFNAYSDILLGISPAF